MHGQVQGEAIIDGDASEGIDVILYAHQPQWIQVEGTASGNGSIVTADKGEPFLSAMQGQTITFANDGNSETHPGGAFAIVSVQSTTTIILDGDFSTLQNRAFVIAEGTAEQVTVVPEANDTLAITDISISQDKDTSYALVAGADEPGKQIIRGNLLELGSVHIAFVQPFVCLPGDILKYFGHSEGDNICLIHGFIT